MLDEENKRGIMEGLAVVAKKLVFIMEEFGRIFQSEKESRSLASPLPLWDDLIAFASLLILQGFLMVLSAIF